MVRLFLAGMDAAVASILIIPLFFVLNLMHFHDRKKTLFCTVLAIYLAGVYLVVGLPTVSYVRFEPNINLIPILDLFSDPSAAILNVLLFLPLGFLSTLMWKPLRSCGNCLILGIFGSVTIELLQIFTFRATDINDVITNTAGCLLGWYLGNRVLKRFPNLSCGGTGKDAFIVLAAVFCIMFFLHPFAAPLIWNLIS